MFTRTDTYVVRNTVPDKRTGEYVLIVRLIAPSGMSHVAFGISTADAVRAQRAGAGFMTGDDAAKLIALAVTD